MAGREPLDEAALREALGPRWRRVSVLAETASTNADLLHDASAPDRSVLVAELQTHGRGRLDRTWTSPPGAGLTFSVLLRPEVPMQFWGWLPLLAGVALAEGVTAATGLAASLKWPNDLMIGGRKAAGVLAQAGTDCVVIGIGLNVSTTSDELPVPDAMSLALSGANVVDRAELLVGILTRLDARAAQWADVRGDAEACGLAQEYRGLCATIGSDVIVTMPADTVVGRAVDVDAGGRLVVESEGQRLVLAAGDVTHVRSN